MISSGVRFSRRISTHAPRTGSDVVDCCPDVRPCVISTHAPRTGSDSAFAESANVSVIFQPTLPARGATLISSGVRFSRRISTHAPRTGSDRSAVSRARSARIFQPTLPARGATRGRRGIPPRPRHFNPRSPHGERPPEVLPVTPAADPFQPTLPARGATRPPPPLETDTQADFNPRSPHGERPRA